MKAGEYVYFVDFKNLGGLVTPLPLTITYADCATENYLVPTEVWRLNADSISKIFIRPKRITSIEIDRRHVTADADYANNQFPPKTRSSRIELYKEKDMRRDQMLDMLAKTKNAKKGDNADDGNVPLASSEQAPAAQPPDAKPPARPQ